MCARAAYGNSWAVYERAYIHEGAREYTHIGYEDDIEHVERRRENYLFLRTYGKPERQCVSFRFHGTIVDSFRVRIISDVCGVISRVCIRTNFMRNVICSISQYISAGTVRVCLFFSSLPSLFVSM